MSKDKPRLNNLPTSVPRNLDGKVAIRVQVDNSHPRHLLSDKRERMEMDKEELERGFCSLISKECYRCEHVEIELNSLGKGNDMLYSYKTYNIKAKCAVLICPLDEVERERRGFVIDRFGRTPSIDMIHPPLQYRNTPSAEPEKLAPKPRQRSDKYGTW